MLRMEYSWTSLTVPSTVLPYDAFFFFFFSRQSNEQYNQMSTETTESKSHLAVHHSLLTKDSY